MKKDWYGMTPVCVVFSKRWEAFWTFWHCMMNRIFVHCRTLSVKIIICICYETGQKDRIGFYMCQCDWGSHK